MNLARWAALRGQGGGGWVRMGLLSLALLAVGGWTTIGGLVKQGWGAYQRGDYEAAFRHWDDAALARPEDRRMSFLQGNALYRLGRFEEAIESYSAAYQGVRTPAQRNRVAYNMGNAFFRLGFYQQAIEAYEKALEANPTDQDARYNLELAKRRLRQQQQARTSQGSSSSQDDWQEPSLSQGRNALAGNRQQPELKGDLSPEEVERLLSYLEEQERVMRRYFNPRPGHLQEEDPFGRDFFSMTRKELEDYIRRHQQELLQPFGMEGGSLSKDW